MLAVILPLWTLVAVLFRVQLRKAYGVREAVPAVPPKPFAEQVAEAVEAQRQAQWDRLMDQAYRARPPMRGQQAVIPPPQPKASPGVPPPQPPVLAGSGASCRHLNAEPVNLLLTGERVAWVCPRCDAQLPANWR